MSRISAACVLEPSVEHSELEEDFVIPSRWPMRAESFGSPSGKLIILGMNPQ